MGKNWSAWKYLRLEDKWKSTYLHEKILSQKKDGILSQVSKETLALFTVAYTCQYIKKTTNQISG